MRGEFEFIQVGHGWSFRPHLPAEPYRPEVQEACARLLSDIFGNPLRPVPIDRVWLRWNYGTAPGIARNVYDDGALHDLPILADALMDAGCGDEEILGHCRSPGPHVRGCWFVDLILGKR